ncbi:MAG: asparagine synthase-related protein [Pseudonocardiaceae bacterium]
MLRDTLSPFVGVTPVPPGYRVQITGRGCRTSRWWTAPEATQPLETGGAALHEALNQAVAGRIGRASGPVSVQLSGGLDSTTLAFLARSTCPLLITTAGRSAIDDDLAWARRAAGLLKGSTHRVIPADEAPLFFADLNAPQSAMDEPASFAAGHARQRYTARLLRGCGTVAHLNGQGGDEVLLAPLTYLRPAIRAVPRTGWRHLRGHAALKDTSSWAMALAVSRNHTSFAAWLRSTVDKLRIEAPAAVAATGWEAPPLLPPWATDEAAELVRAAILTAEPTTVSDDPVTHAAVVRIRASAYRAALYREAMQIDGVPTAMPFFDRRVMEACLSVLPWERTDPWCPKPLLRAAFSDVVPAAVLSRRTKGEYNADIHHGWSIHRRQVAELLDGSRLVEHGLIDPVTLRAALSAFGPSGLPPAWITDLIAVETWLRDLASPFTAHQEAINAAITAASPPPPRDQARPYRGDRAR